MAVAVERGCVSHSTLRATGIFATLTLFLPLLLYLSQTLTSVENDYGLEIVVL